jgi:hypothetical protein
MFRRVCYLTVLLVAIGASRTYAQFTVIDPGNLVQTTLIASRTEQHYQQLLAEFQTIRRMAQGLTSLDRYRLPSIALTTHDPSGWQYGRPWIQGLNTGDPNGTLYQSTALPLERPDARLAQLPMAARQAFERRYATVEITDSIATLAGHQVGLTRSYDPRMQQAVASLERDVLSTQSGYHEMTAILDKIAAGELLARRQDMASNQLLSHELEQLLARCKRLRDTEAATINMQLVAWRDAQTANEAFVAGTGDALRAWRQK